MEETEVALAPSPQKPYETLVEEVSAKFEICSEF